MVINLQELPSYREAIGKLSAEIAAGVSTERQEELFAEAFTTLGEEINAKTEKELEKMVDVRLKNKSMTAEEIQFFNEVATVKKDVGTKDPKLIPEETMIQVFEDLKTEHPLLSVISFKNTSVRLKTLTAETSGLAVWGPIYGEIKGQLDHAFHEDEFSQNKLTAFVVVPKDALKFSYTWLKQFIMDQIKEQMSVALETAIISGDGKYQPIGLMKDLSQAPKVVKENGVSLITYPTNKTAIDVKGLTPQNAIEKLVPVMRTLSTKEESGLPIRIDGKVRILINPLDRWELESKFTSINLNGVYTTNLPHGIQLIESLVMEQGTAIAFVPERYEGFMAANATIEEFDQTFAMEDMQLFLTKGYFHGKPKDNNVSVVLTIAETITAKTTKSKKASASETAGA